ncbi:MAG: hypothetical protein H6834_10315, partial [Planctomycetes bacterium]|nr:hypothetical protein [Planctomycetota bacterium]
GVPLLWIGNSLNAFPLCLPSQCMIGAEFGIVLPLASLHFAVGCDPALLGGSISIQGGDWGGVGGCSFPALTTSNTIDTMIR